MLQVAEHPLLDLAWFVSELAQPLSEIESPEWLRELLTSDAEAPLAADDGVRRAVRDLLRHGGFKPTGRNKPSAPISFRGMASRV